ncbi:MAG: MarR family transcriptional regulator [Mycobacteriaceae bacterium]
MEPDPAVALTRFFSWWRRSAPRTTHPSASVSALDCLDVDGPQRITDLAAAERITQPGMSALVTRLAADGLVTRAADPDDGRVALVSITGVGRDALAATRAARSDELRRRLAALTDAERHALDAAVPALNRLTSGDTL